MKSRQGLVIYIGKAKNLKKRVSSYFNKTLHDYKTSVLVSHISDIETIVTHTENEALILESQLIKQHQPKYNILLKDDKSYPYIKITNELFPRIQIVRTRINDRATYFGPFPSIGSTKYLKGLLYDLFPIRDCKQEITRVDLQPKCLLLDIQKCIGPCVHKQVKEEYDRYIYELSLLLSGKNNELVRELKKKMEEYSMQLAFEKAARVRDMIYKIKQFNQKQDVHLAEDIHATVWGIERRKNAVYIIIQAYIDGKLLRQKGYYHNDVYDDESLIIEQCFMSYFMEFEPSKSDIICDSDVGRVLSSLVDQGGLPFTVYTPQKGIKKDVLMLATKNAKLSLLRVLSQEPATRKTQEDLLGSLQREYALKNRPECIIGIDISHSQGTNIVGSAVCFKQGLPFKQGYRRFSIKTVSGDSNDPLSIKEVVFRRLSSCITEKEAFPDLILIDGGRAQLNFAVQALKELNLLDKIDIISLAKKQEEVYTLNRQQPYLSDKFSSVTKLLQRVRDESHRFAVSYQRIKRSSVSKKILLEEIEGLGQTRINRLYSHFGTIERMKDASITELAAIPGIGNQMANQIHFFLDYHLGVSSS